jgi:ABC-type branched-subunit amino acid transport system ATPase component
MTSVLSCRDVRVHFGGVRAVDGVTLSLQAGRIYGLVGPNGSGKSTLMGVLSGLTTMTSGSIAIDGRDITRMPAWERARAGVARTFQTVRLPDGLTVLQNVMLGADTTVTPRGFIRNWFEPWATRRRDHAVRHRALDALERLGVVDYADRSPSTLPYGIQRRVEIARAVASSPRIIMLDEPTAGMSREERDEVGDLLRTLRDDGLTVLLVEHDVPLMVKVSEVLYVLNVGTIIAEGDPSEVVALPAVQDAYLGRRHADAA